MSATKATFSEYAFSAMPGFDESSFRKLFAQAIDLKTIVIHCFDPRAVEIPEAVARRFPGEVYPGENVFDEAGNKVGHTRTLFAVSVAGGRAVAGLQSMSTMEHLFGFENVVVVHHSYCGATSFTTDGMLDAYEHEHGVDISSEYDRGSISITDYEASLNYDVALVRASPGVPKHVNVFGFFYNIDTGELIEVVRDAGQKAEPRHV
jgi:carbonic anhydrase